MKTSTKLLVLTSMLIGISAQAKIHCIINGETERGSNSYGKYLGRADVEDTESGSDILRDEKGEPLEIDGYSYSVSWTKDSLAVFIFQLETKKIEAGAVANAQSYVAVMSPSAGQSLSCAKLPQ